ncbi:MAG: hypothetical protein IPF93_08535 [Saprospiraceae bacterium]|nr:hypothetical protein [Saprospiraceae bacterium]
MQPIISKVAPCLTAVRDLGIPTGANGAIKSAYHHSLHWIMCRKASIYQTPNRLSTDPLSTKSGYSNTNSIGALSRDHGEE